MSIQLGDGLSGNACSLGAGLKDKNLPVVIGDYIKDVAPKIDWAIDMLR